MTVEERKLANQIIAANTHDGVVDLLAVRLAEGKLLLDEYKKNNDGIEYPQYPAQQRALAEKMQPMERATREVLGLIPNEKDWDHSDEGWQAALERTLGKAKPEGRGNNLVALPHAKPLNPDLDVPIVEQGYQFVTPAKKQELDKAAAKEAVKDVKKAGISHIPEHPESQVSSSHISNLPATPPTSLKQR